MKLRKFYAALAAVLMGGCMLTACSEDDEPSVKQAITPETATLLGQVFSTPAEMWLNLQARYDLRKIDDQDSPKKELAEQKAVLRKYMPVGEIKKKGWFQYDVSTIEGIRRECRRVFGQDSVPVLCLLSSTRKTARNMHTIR